MRLPLFTSGYPQVPNQVADPVSDSDSCLQVIDLRSLSVEDQEYNRFITLFAWPSENDEGLLTVYVQTGSDDPVLFGSIYGISDLDDTSPSSMSMVVRGNVRVFINNPNGDGVAVFGYLEVQDNIPTVEILRPLQPSDPASPFNVVPRRLGTSDEAVIHGFAENYIDSVSISYVIDQTVSGTGEAHFIFPNGTILATKVDGTTEGQVHMMSGIPMIPEDSDQFITVTTSSDITSLVVSGTFTRT